MTKTDVTYMKLALLRMKSLALMIRFHQHDYYKGEPRISDYEFDKMFQELLTLEADHPELVIYNTPTKIVGH